MKKYIALFLVIIFAFTNTPIASDSFGRIANSALLCFSAATPIKTNTGFKPIEDIRIGDFVLTKDERTGKTGQRNYDNHDGRAPVLDSRARLA
ncbi:Hint domain-containing protein [Paenibacillus thiaminolyticus]|uniref:Hint domain-containing protein n=1 Tax=Paenibacillus thiaminolyticus TaxID=49283 RepID=UPI0025434035|nr:Hint domain-containing protein [Paenibacillus thiaminolyticus]WII40571.1 Hint domain-containing protein [Paenibacillus thiaminolyticus]